MTFGRYAKCDSCGQTQAIRTTLIYVYVLHNNQQIPGCAIPAWCFDCGGIRDAERLPTLERLGQLLVNLESNGLDRQALKDKAAFLKIDLDPHREYAKELAQRRAVLDWRSNRVSPPRCLVCGGTNHSPVQCVDTGFEHPGCGGVFRTEQTFHSYQGVYWEVDSEGNRLPGKSV